ncbi:MAG: nitroreductase/quinone reductase family protein [Halieaceae bacterium]|uniref:nitroreductase/quinone reductase family protein n=1 Tax=Haliea alexandrii TaxID=2448162 RepID=UPI000F0BA498|nr:nitroreductase/quinone reductase family protein [Haliea alexandrii]MCR9184691.1 nitroreductase/quinone reductase family protein [Halieaceae bacterium]
MFASLSTLERNLFRGLNAVVEPAVRNGVASSCLLPVSMIVLESTGFKSGSPRRTPLWSLAAGPYRVIGTARGGRSFWVKNLQKTPQVQYFIGGKARPATALVVTPGYSGEPSETSPALLRWLLERLRGFPVEGWEFAILMSRPVAGKL